MLSFHRCPERTRISPSHLLADKTVYIPVVAELMMAAATLAGLVLASCAGRHENVAVAHGELLPRPQSP